MIKIYVTRTEKWIDERRQPGYEFEKGEFVSYATMYLWGQDTGFKINSPTHTRNTSILQFPDEYEFRLFCIKHGITSSRMKEAPYARI